MTKEPIRIAPVMRNLLAAAEAGTVVLAARALARGRIVCRHDAVT